MEKLLNIWFSYCSRLYKSYNILIYSNHLKNMYFKLQALNVKIKNTIQNTYTTKQYLVKQLNDTHLYLKVK